MVDESTLAQVEEMVFRQQEEEFNKQLANHKNELLYDRAKYITQREAAFEDAALKLEMEHEEKTERIKDLEIDVRRANDMLALLKKLHKEELADQRAALMEEMDERIQAAVELKEISMLQQRKKLLAAEEREVEELRLLVESKVDREEHEMLIEQAIIEKEKSMLAQRALIMEEQKLEMEAKMAEAMGEEASDEAKIAHLQAEVTALKDEKDHAVEEALAHQKEEMLKVRMGLLHENAEKMAAMQARIDELEAQLAGRKPAGKGPGGKGPGKKAPPKLSGELKTTQDAEHAATHGSPIHVHLGGRYLKGSASPALSDGVDDGSVWHLQADGAGFRINNNSGKCLATEAGVFSTSIVFSNAQSEGAALLGDVGLEHHTWTLEPVGGKFYVISSSGKCLGENGKGDLELTSTKGEKEQWTLAHTGH